MAFHSKISVRETYRKGAKNPMPLHTVARQVQIPCRSIPFRRTPKNLYRHTVPEPPQFPLAKRVNSRGYGIGIPYRSGAPPKTYTVVYRYGAPPKTYTVKPYTYVSRTLVVFTENMEKAHARDQCLPSPLGFRK